MSTKAHMAVYRLTVEQRNKAWAELDAERGVLAMAVAQLGGMVEGAPTHRGNFLQRIRTLVEAETRVLAAVAKMRAEVRDMRSLPLFGATNDAEYQRQSGRLAAFKEALAAVSIFPALGDEPAQSAGAVVPVAGVVEC